MAPMTAEVAGRRLAPCGGSCETSRRDAAAFLIGKCSCQVKEQNPGVDLLMKADWTSAAKASPVLDRNLPTLEELLPVKTVTTEAKPAATGLPRWALGAGVLLLAMAGLWLLRR